MIKIEPRKGVCHLCARQNDLVAFVATYDAEDTLWVVNIRGDVILRWTSCRKISTEWATNRRFLVAQGEPSDLSIVGISVP